MNTQAPIKVTLIGMEERSRKILTRILSSSETPACVISDKSTADIAIVDMDDDTSIGQLLALHEVVDIPAIVLSEREIHAPNSHWVVKPVQSRTLLQMIWKLGKQQEQRLRRQRRQRLAAAGSRRMRQELDRQLAIQPMARTHQIAAKSSQPVADELLCGNEAESTYLATRLSARLFYDPSQHLQSIVQGAVDEVRLHHKPMIVRGLGRDIVIFDEGEMIACGLSEFQLRKICKARFDKKLVVFLAINEKAIDLEALRNIAERYEVFMWKLALWSASGRLPVGTDLDKPVSIARWPNLTRLALFPHAVQLAALWHRQAISIRATAILLDVSYKYIFSFYAACLQLGLIREHSRPESFRLQAPENRAGRGLLGKVLGYLNRRIKGRSS